MATVMKNLISPRAKMIQGASGSIGNAVTVDFTADTAVAAVVVLLLLLLTKADSPTSGISRDDLLGVPDAWTEEAISSLGVDRPAGGLGLGDEFPLGVVVRLYKP